jgi:hypothetical protein
MTTISAYVPLHTWMVSSLSAAATAAPMVEYLAVPQDSPSCPEAPVGETKSVS